MGHVRLKRSDPRFWGSSRLRPLSLLSADPVFVQITDYNIKELALYDLPAMVDHVRRETGYDKVSSRSSSKLDRRDHELTSPVAHLEQIAFIGHSQGNATMFCSLGSFLSFSLTCASLSIYRADAQPTLTAQGMVPELGLKLSIFIALAPAVYAGPLTTGFPFGALKSMKWKTWRRWFG